MSATALEGAVAEAGRLREAFLPRRVRRTRGVVHTPPELARYAVRAADEAARRELGLAGGLADPRVTIVDPCAGPGVFLAAALAVAGERTTRPHAVWALDVDGGALATARRELRPAFARAGWPLSFRRGDTLRDASWWEPQRADALVIVGNPPWHAGPGRPAPRHLRSLLDEFAREDDGAPLRERKLGVLADSYVRFMAWALACLRGGRGVFALVTNASFLDGPVHRGMRAVLCRELDALDILDLGGNVMLARDAGRDENVCGVRPGVAMTVGVRASSRSARDGTPAQIRYGALRGTAAHKFAVLVRGADSVLAPLRVSPPLRRLVPTRVTPRGYASWPSLAEAMPFHREGVQTNRDALAVAAGRESLIARLDDFARGRALDGAAGQVAVRRLGHYDPARARAAVREALAHDPDGLLGISAAPLAYRRGDLRWFAPIAPLCHRPRPVLRAAMAHAPLALVTVRKDRGNAAWTHVDVVRAVPDSSYLSSRSSCRTRAFPVAAPDGAGNLAPAVAARLTACAGRAVSAHDFLHYAFAILSARTYRAEFDVELRIDYPRIPWPADVRSFNALVRAGRELAVRASAPPDESSVQETFMGALDARVAASW